MTYFHPALNSFLKTNMADKAVLADRSRLSLLAAAIIIGNNTLSDVLSRCAKCNVTMSEHVFARYDSNMPKL